MSELAAEQSHLAYARTQLARMRERTSRLDGAGAADWVSREYLESALALRMKQLADDPSIPLFFGRIDSADESFHIGRRHISDPSGDPLVIDWRAPVSRPFYRASASDPMGLRRRRRYGFSHGSLTAYEDESLTETTPDHPGHSGILEAEIEKPRVGPMRDIVATIQPEQDAIVRSELATSVCVQGAPGTGKTAVGLHRAAYLLYAHRDQLTRQGALVVGPNDSFLRYIGDVLPALGEIDVKQTTIETLVAGGPAIAATEPADVATLKGDARLATVLSRALWSLVAEPTEGLLVPRGSRRWRVGADEIGTAMQGLRSRGVRYGAGRAMLPQTLAHLVLVQMENAGESPDDRVQNAVARSRPVKDLVAAIWPATTPEALLHRLLSDADFLAAAASGVLEPAEQAALLWARPPRSARSAPWTLADHVLLDELKDLLERTGSLAHLVIDEAQDLSPMMLRALARRSTTGSLTVLGDLAQATTPWATLSWAEALVHLGKPDAHVEELTRGFRVPGEVIDFAARLLPTIAPTLAPPTSVRRSRGELSFGPLSSLVDTLDRIAPREGSIGVIVPDTWVTRVLGELGHLSVSVVGADESPFDAHLDLVPASVAKGLEFDHVVVLEPAAIVAAEPDLVTGLRRLYVCLTRAVTSLVVLHDEPLPESLAD
jgi:DNA helicase IV